MGKSCLNCGWEISSMDIVSLENLIIELQLQFYQIFIDDAMGTQLQNFEGKY